MARVTIEDIAKRAGVHSSTVSRALRKDSRLPQETCERIRQIASEMNYRPNLMARGLVGRNTQTVAIVSRTLRDQFYVDLVEVQERYLSEHGYSPLLAVGHFLDEDDGRSRESFYTLEDFVLRGVDGVVFHDFPTDPEMSAELSRLIDDGMPMVFYGLHSFICQEAVDWFMTREEAEDALVQVLRVSRSGWGRLRW